VALATSRSPVASALLRPGAGKGRLEVLPLLLHSRNPRINHPRKTFVLFPGLSILLLPLHQSQSSAQNQPSQERKTHLSISHKTLHNHIRVFQVYTGVYAHQYTNPFPETTREAPTIVVLVLEAVVQQAKEHPVPPILKLWPVGCLEEGGIMLILEAGV
jgi:hypothetical protein